MSEYSKAMSDMLDREPMRSVIEALNTMTEAVMNHTGRHGIKRLDIEGEWALSLGLLPGQSMKIATSSGEVEIRSLGDQLTVGGRPLTPAVRVRVPLPEPGRSGQ